MTHKEMNKILVEAREKYKDDAVITKSCLYPSGHTGQIRSETIKMKHWKKEDEFFIQAALFNSPHQYIILYQDGQWAEKQA